MAGTILYYIGTVLYNPTVLTILIIGAFIFFSIKAWQRPIWAVALYFLLSTVNPVKFSPMLAAIQPVTLAALLAIVCFFLNPQHREIRFPGLWVFFIFFLMCSALSYLTCQYPELAEKRFMEYNKAALVSLLGLWFLKDRQDFKILFTTSLFSIYFLVLKNLVETQTKGKWVVAGGSTGWIGDSNDWALAIAMAVPLAFVSLARAQERRTKIFHGLALLSCVVAMSLTSSRGGFLGLVAAAVVLFIVESRKVRFIAFGLVVVFITSLYMPDDFVRQIESLTHERDIASQGWEGDLRGGEYTGAQRLWFWRAAWEMMQENPVTGVGWGHFAHLRASQDETDSTHAVVHNTWLQVGSEAGFPGLITFAALIFGTMLMLYTTQRRGRLRGDPFVKQYASALLAGLAAYCVSGTFISREYSDLLFSYLTMAPALMYFSYQTVQCGDPAEEPGKAACTTYTEMISSAGRA